MKAWDKFKADSRVKLGQAKGKLDKAKAKMKRGKRKHVNVVTVALANKTARIAWAVAHNDTAYDPTLAAGGEVV